MRDKLKALKYSGILRYYDVWFGYVDGTEYGPFETNESALYEVSYNTTIVKLLRELEKNKL